jgi:3'-phosphoadenosine 5'-phosphosulfate sulfotransferase (PAPS reductase)/FAD synthetase
MSVSELQRLEAESIHVMREVAAELERPVLMFSGGKAQREAAHQQVDVGAPAPAPQLDRQEHDSGEEEPADEEGEQMPSVALASRPS